MKRYLGALASLLVFMATAQNTSFLNYCNQAYQVYPSVPRGVLEAISFTQTRMAYLDASELESCTGLPKSRGYFGMIANGKGYFKENLKSVAHLSGTSVRTIQQHPEAEVMAYAKAFSVYMEQSKGQSMEQALKYAFLQLSYLPDTGAVNNFARNAELYELFRFLNKEENASVYHFPKYRFNLETIFGMANLAVLSAEKVQLLASGIVSNTGAVYVLEKSTTLKSTEYAPAIWNATPTCNFSSRNGTAVSAITIHTIQGTYAGAISWAQNCSSSVSYHYVVRSSDGQITQMVSEADKAWHVGSENPYTIGYEHEGYISQSQWYTTALYNASAGITRDVCQSGYGINPLRTFSGAATTGTNVLGSCIKIKGHQHYPNQTHTDPGIYWDWALYYQLVNNNPAQTTLSTATGTFTDTGGSAANYSDDERYFTLIQPANATSINLTFSSFSTEANWDYLYIYDGSTTGASLIGTYTGTNSPGTISSSGGSLLIEFRSDCATTAAGWQASWTSTIPTVQPADAVPPTTTVSAPTTWITQAFTTSFTDADNAGGSGLEKSYYQVIDYDGADWRANGTKGFFSDNFDQSAIHPDWTSQTGVWGLSNSNLVQTDETNSNTNLWASVNHTLSNRYLYHWAGAMSGTGTNRRAGLHYFCSDPTLTNRGNSYFVFFRLDNDKVQIYEVTNDVFTLMNEVSFDFNAGQWYDYKVMYDRISGKHQVYIDNSLVQTWVDTTPLATGNYISFRSGNCVYNVNDLKVYRSRYPSVTVGVGATEELRYQSVNPSTVAGRIKSIVQDSTGNLSAIQSQDVYVDWTAPTDVLTVNDGVSADIATTTNNTLLEANWSSSSDPHSDVARYWYAIGTTPGATDVQIWTDNYWNTAVSVGGLNLSIGTTYYFSIRVENGAGLLSNVVSSDGQTLIAPSDPPIANFVTTNTFVCSGTAVDFQNNSSNGTSFEWSFSGGTPAVSTATNPSVVFPATGSYTVQLIATGPGGVDTTAQTIQVQVDQPNTANFSVNASILYLPSAMLTCTNNSANANGYWWDFGDGATSQDTNPWHVYTQPGIYTVLLTAVNDACPVDTASIQVQVLDVTELDENPEFELQIYPNPAQNEVFVQVTFVTGNLYLYDQTGRLVYDGKLENGLQLIDVSKLSHGVYRLVAENGDVVLDRNLVLVK